MLAIELQQCVNIRPHPDVVGCWPFSFFPPLFCAFTFHLPLSVAACWQRLWVDGFHTSYPQAGAEPAASSDQKAELRLRKKDPGLFRFSILSDIVLGALRARLNGTSAADRSQGACWRQRNSAYM